MTFLRKLILTFTLLAFLPLLLMAGVLLGSQRLRLLEVGREHVHSMAAHTARRLDLLLERTVEQVEQLGLSQSLATELETANRSYEGLGEQEARSRLLALDAEWLSVTDPSESEIVGRCLSNPAARQLRLFQTCAPERFAEIMLTDRAGALHSATNVTTDYYQADEEWWQHAFAGGKGRTFVGDIGYDASAGVFSVDVAAPVRNEAAEVVGILKISHDVNALFEIVGELRTGRTGRGHLVNAAGRTVFAAAARPDFEQFGAQTMAAFRAEADGVFVGRVGPAEEKQVVGFAALESTSPDGKASVGDAPWFAVLTQSAAEVYAPYRRAFLWTVVVLLLPLAGLVLLAAYLKKSLVAPIGALHWATEQMAAGHLDVRVQIGEGDEMQDVGYQFNRMAAALQRHEEEQRLEIRRRTDELRQTDMQARRVREAMSAEMNSISEGMRQALDQMRQASEEGLDVRENLQLASEAWMTVRAFAEDLDDLCKVEGGRMRLELHEVRFGEVIESARRVLGGLLRRYQVELEFPAEDMELQLVADPPKLKQVLYALLSNAVKFGGPGSTVSVSARRDADATVIAVHDEGPGIRPERQEAIFDPLLGPSPQARTGAENIGLGLSIAKQLVELHGGSIWVESAPGSGSTFYVRLPDRDLPEQGQSDTDG